MKFKPYFKVTAAVFLSAWLAGCVTGLQGDTYTQDDVRRVQTIRYATVEDVRMVVIEGKQSGVGTVAGGLIGGIAGSSIGGGKGSDIAAVAGAVVGGLLGNRAEEAASRKQGIEIILRMEDSNKVVAVVQEYDPTEVFQPGDRVRMMTVNGQTRVAQ